VLDTCIRICLSCLSAASPPCRAVLCCAVLCCQLLTKTYHMLDDTEPVLERSEGCSIDWKPGKNVTVKVGTDCSTGEGHSGSTVQGGGRGTFGPSDHVCILCYIEPLRRIGRSSVSQQQPFIKAWSLHQAVQGSILLSGFALGGIKHHWLQPETTARYASTN